jgi:hypothetical protein
VSGVGGVGGVRSGEVESRVPLFLSC